MAVSQLLPCDFADYSAESAQRTMRSYVKDIQDLLPPRYRRLLQETNYALDWLYEQINADLASPHENIREDAFAACCVALPSLQGSLMDALDERCSHNPKWRDQSGSDQRFLNGCIDVMTQLYSTLVKEGRFAAKQRSDRGDAVAYI